MELSLAPELGLYMPGSLEVFKTIFGTQLFSDLEFTDEEIDKPMELYDELRQSGIDDFLENCLISNRSYQLFISLLYQTIDKFEKYQTSAYGILDSLKKDYNDMDFNIEKLQEKIKNKENIEYLDEVMEKMGGAATTTPIK
jgi:flagellar biosynthesis chaperone FliJ